MEALTKKDIQKRNYTASYEFEEILLKHTENMQDEDIIIYMAYTDYGGSTIDQCYIEYIQNKYPDKILVEDTNYYGKNAFILDKALAQEINNQLQNCILGFEEVEEFYCKLEYEAKSKVIEQLINDNNFKKVDFELAYVLVSEYIDFPSSFDNPDCDYNKVVGLLKSSSSED